MIRTLLLTLAVVGMASSAHAGSCAKSTAAGLGVTKEIATFMSNKALHNMIEKNGEKGRGAVTTTCETTLLSTTCHSSQRTCR